MEERGDIRLGSTHTFGPTGLEELYCEIAPHMTKRENIFARDRANSRTSPPTLSKNTSIRSGVFALNCSLKFAAL